MSDNLWLTNLRGCCVCQNCLKHIPAPKGIFCANCQREGPCWCASCFTQTGDMEFTVKDTLSITAKLLAGARALSLSDRHHFDLNLSDLLDKSTQCKRNWLLNVIAARQRFERQHANFEGIQILSIANSKLIKCMTAGRASQCPLNHVLPNTPALGHDSVPSLPGPKIMLCLQLKIPL